MTSRSTAFTHRCLMVTAGALFPLALAPLFWWPLGLISLGLFAYLLQSSTNTRQAFVLTWWFSFAKFAVGVSWIYVSIHRFGGTPAPLAVLMVALFAASLAIIPAMVIALYYRYVGLQHAWLTLPAAWFFYELVRSHLLTGFPWLFAGDAHLYSWLSGWAPLIGSYGLSFLVLISVSSLLFAWRSGRYYALAVLLVWPVGLWLSTFEWTEKTGELQVSAVQGNIAQEMKWRPEMVGETLSIYHGQTQEHWQSDLVLWPETAITLLLEQYLPYMDDLDHEAREQHTTIISGIPYRYARYHPLAGEFHNSIIAFGNGDGLYHKQRLVPFGEFVPLEKQIRGLLPFFDLDMSSFLPGDANQPLLSVNKDDRTYLIAPFICYEIAYPQLVSRMSKHADMLVTISNDAWFGDSLGPKQHMALAQMRALETGRYLLRATNTGITALVNHKGEILNRLPYETRATLTGMAEMRTGQTPYMLWGLWPLVIISGLLLVGSALLRIRKEA